MSQPIQRAGAWWQQMADGTWLKWNQSAANWERMTSPPPPPPPPSSPPAALVSAPAHPSGGSPRPSTPRGPAFPPAHPVAGMPHGPMGYRPLAGVGRATVIALWVMVAVLALMTLSNVTMYLTSSSLEVGLATGSVSGGSAVAAGAYLLGAAALGLLYGLGSLVCAILFIAWMHRAHSNLPALGASGLRYSPGWAIGGWFVPVLNILRPKQVADEIHSASNPHAPADMGTSWRGHAPQVVLVWWVTWLAGGALSWIASTLMASDSSGLGGLRSGLLLDAIANLVLIAAGYFAVRVVKEITDRQERRVVRLSPPGA